MKKKIGTCILFLCSLAAVFGGEFWNLMNWLRLCLLAGITLISGFRLFHKS